MTNWEKYREEIKHSAMEPKNTSKSKARIIIETVEKHICRHLDIFQALDWLTQEVGSEETYTEEEKYKMSHACRFYGNQCGLKCDGLDANCEIRREYEPQQSKARFVKVNDDLIIRADQIQMVQYNEENWTDIFGQFSGGNYVINKPIDQVIQELGIEVI